MVNAATPGSPGVFPLCFSSAKDYAGWKANARKVAFHAPGDHAYCEDCTMDHQWRMLLTKRCDNPAANPEA